MPTRAAITFVHEPEDEPDTLRGRPRGDRRPRNRVAEPPADLDLFIVGLDEAATAKMIEELLTYLVQKARDGKADLPPPDNGRYHRFEPNLADNCMLARSQFQVSFCDREGNP